MTAIVSPGDFDGDDNPDILARDTTGDLWLYPRTSTNTWKPRTKIGAGWNTMTAIAPGATSQNPDVVERPADGVFRLVGRGFGHGRGMSQWGANQAAALGASWRSIVSFYFPTARITARGDESIRVRITADTGYDLIVRPETGLRVGWTTPTGSRADVTAPTRIGDCVPRWWRVRAVGTGQSIEYLCDSWREWQPADSVRGNAPVDFRPTDGTVDTAVRTSGGFVRKEYRGVLEGVNTSGSIAVTNTVPLESYLKSVVPSEVPAAWPAEALRSQAVAARTYALREKYDRAGSAFDVYDSTASQVYLGRRLYDDQWSVVRDYEDPRTDSAVQATAGAVLEYAGVPAFTQFSSSNGGWTASGSHPYLPGQRDDWDRAATANPYREWTDAVTAQTLEARYPQLGRLTRIRVVERDGGGMWGGRIRVLILEGTSGSVSVSGDTQVRAALDTRSSYVAFT
jgi:SpoIID/LytB domain protein